MNAAEASGCSDWPKWLVGRNLIVQLGEWKRERERERREKRERELEREGEKADGTFLHLGFVLPFFSSKCRTWDIVPETLSG